MKAIKAFIRKNKASELAHALLQGSFHQVTSTDAISLYRNSVAKPQITFD